MARFVYFRDCYGSTSMACGGGEFAAAVAFALFLDGIKIPTFTRLKIS
jgi:hypothetical protein